jgi:hypothetical protein
MVSYTNLHQPVTRGRQRMTRITTSTLLFTPLALAGCNGAFVGNLIVLGMTVGIFYGTLTLGRSTETRDTATRSANGSKNG